MAEQARDIVTDGVKVTGILNRMALFDGLSDEDAQVVAGRCSTAIFSSGAPLFESNEPAECMYIVVEGSVRIVLGDEDQLLGFVGSGETVGEVSLLTGEPHSATARAEAPVMAAAITREGLDGLIRERPDLGLVLYRNLAIGLGRKLQKTDHWLAGDV